MKKLTILALISPMFLAFQCNKTEETPYIGNISIQQPMENDTISGGKIIIGAAVTGNKEIHGYQINLLNDATNALISSKSIHMHGDNFVILDSLNYTINQLTKTKLEIVLEVDHDGNLFKKSQFVYIQQ